MATMTISEARAALADVLDRAGRGEEITITRHGRPVAVVPAGLAVVSSPPATVPGPPGTLAASASSGAVTLSWSAPSSNGGSAVVGYAIFKGTTYDGESSTPVNSSPVATTSYTVTGLTNGTTYYFTVEAVNALGASAASNQASATPMAGPPPVTLYATPSGSATSGCTSSTTTPCSLSGAIAVAGASRGTVIIDLVSGSGAACATASPCTFDGAQSVSSGSEASLTIEGSGTGSASSAATVLNGGSKGTTFTHSASLPVTLQELTVSGGGNAVISGGIYNSSGTMTVTDSTISGNSAITGSSYGASGGGIVNNGTMTVSDSRIRGNHATGVPGAASIGGGILNGDKRTMTVTGSTVSDNTASATGYPGGSGAGIFSHHSTSATVVVTLAGSIVADQAHGSNCHGSVIDAGYNLSNGTSCGFGTAFPAPPGSKDSVANLDLASSLASNGGPTETIALGAHSAADTAISSPAMATLGGVSVNLCSDTSYETAAGVNADLALDQRGVSRPATGCSAGAYQAALTVPGAPTALTAELKRLAEKPSLEEVLDRIERHSGGRVGLGQAAVDLAEQRTNR